MKLLTVNNLSAGYNGTDIIKNISFSVDSGQIIGILGANGCGKTTLIKSWQICIHIRGTVSLIQLL